MSSERPNILFLMSDEHRADVAGFAGDEIVRTPTLDRLAGTGVVFRNAYTPAPICIPGRQAMMSGKFPRTCGCERYGQDLEPESMTFARRFSQYAYQTTCVGKLHHCGPDQMQGWLERPFGDVNIGPRFIDGRVEEEFGRYSKPPGYKWSDAKQIIRAGIGRSPYVQKDSFATEVAVDYIHRYFEDPYYDRPGFQPLMLKLSLVQPHYPYQTDKSRFLYYLNRVRPYVDETVLDHPFLSQREVVPGRDVSKRDLRRATAAYYGMIDCIDSYYAAVLSALEKVGQDLDDWIIVYCSDHGEMLGQHGVWEKQKFFEGSVRVPLVIRWPKRFDGGRVVDENVNLCDLFATLCELAGIPAPEGLQSRSLVGLMEGRTEGWDNESVSQFHGQNLMIKRDALKYQWYGEDMPEVLFDLERDSGETRNFIHDPQYADALANFRRRKLELGF